MRRGDFASAWRISDTILQERRGIDCCRWPRHQQFIWDGEPIADKRVLVRCYHGLGDTVQFIRYAPLVRAQARELVVWAQAALVELVRSVPGVDHVLPLHDGVPGIVCDIDLEIMELPHLCRSTLETIPSQVPYLRVPPESTVASGMEHCRPGCRVGVVWQAGDWDLARSLPSGMLTALAEIPGVTLCALQRGAALASWRGEDGPVVGDDDVVKTARAMQSLDLIISVDSFPAHLAGALGRPVWTLLHAAADWRWMDARTDSPWYPTMRLFRQQQPGDWPGVMREVAVKLREFVAAAGVPLP